jgi:hypothetical protein
MTLADLERDLHDEHPTSAFDRRAFAATMQLPITVPPHPGRIAPPPAPVPGYLRNRMSRSDAEWLASLPSAARAVLQAAAMQAGEWPAAPRIAGAVAIPIE